MLRPWVGKGHRVENDAASDEPRKKPVQQAQQPFKGEDPADVQWAGFGDHQVGQFLPAVETDGEIGEHQAQKADAAFDCPGQRRSRDDAATEELLSLIHI